MTSSPHCQLASSHRPPCRRQSGRRRRNPRTPSASGAPQRERARGGRDRETERQRDRDTETQSDRDIEKQRDRDIETEEGTEQKRPTCVLRPSQQNNDAVDGRRTLASTLELNQKVQRGSTGSSPWLRQDAAGARRLAAGPFGARVRRADRVHQPAPGPRGDRALRQLVRLVAHAWALRPGGHGRANCVSRPLPSPPPRLCIGCANRRRLWSTITVTYVLRSPTGSIP
jgi:hypothetical protein